MQPKSHPDAESAIAIGRDDLIALLTKRWADAYSLRDQTKIDAIAHHCDAIHELFADVCQEIDWPADRKIHTVSSKNEERISA
jgi:hypothetical protein